MESHIFFVCLLFPSAYENCIYTIVVQSLSRAWLCNSMDCSKQGLPIPHHLPEFTQVHDHWVSDAIQPSHPLLSPSPPAPNPSQHQGLFKWVNSSHEVTKVLEFQLQHQSFQWIFRVHFPYDWLGESPCCPKDSNLFQNHGSKAPILWRSAFFMVQLSHQNLTTRKT